VIEGGAAGKKKTINGKVKKKEKKASLGRGGGEREIFDLAKIKRSQLTREDDSNQDI